MSAAKDARDRLYELYYYKNRCRELEQRWIPVSHTTMPEPFVSVLVYMPQESPHLTVCEGFVSNDGHWIAGDFRREPDEVTHWMEMPKPPAEERDST